MIGLAIAADVRFTPESGQIADISGCPLCAKSGLMHCSKIDASLDHLVGTSEQRKRESKSERLGGLEVEDQLDFHCLLHRQFGRLLALKYPAGVDADRMVRVPKTDSVAHKTAGQSALAPRVDRGHPVACR